MNLVLPVYLWSWGPSLIIIIIIIMLKDREFACSDLIKLASRYLHCCTMELWLISLKALREPKGKGTLHCKTNILYNCFGRWTSSIIWYKYEDDYIIAIMLSSNVSFCISAHECFGPCSFWPMGKCLRNKKASGLQERIIYVSTTLITLSVRCVCKNGGKHTEFMCIIFVATSVCIWIWYYVINLTYDEYIWYKIDQ